jgi:hypothetical protein
MAENIGGTNYFSSGGHVWNWRSDEVIDKRVGTVGVRGQCRIVTHQSSRECVIEGVDGGPAILKAAGADRAAAGAAMRLLTEAIEAVRRSGQIATWEDDVGRTGDAIAVHDVQWIGARQYSGDGTICWQFYRATLVELTGKY